MYKVNFLPIVISLIPAMFFICSCGSGPGTAEKEKPQPYVSPTTIPGPTIFAPGKVSTRAPEFGTAFSKDGKTVYFNVTNPDRSVIKLVSSTYEHHQWSQPVALPFSDGTYRDVDPFVSPDGTRLLFSSNRPGPTQAGSEDYDTWYVEKQDYGWSEPVNIGTPLNSEANEVFVSVTDKGTVYFSSNRDGERRIYRSEFAEGLYTQPQPLKIEGVTRVGNPCISPDERFLIFVSAGKNKDGDLYISYFKDGAWTPAENLGTPVNSVYSEFAPGLSPDGKYLYFTSERPGIVAKGEVQGRPPGDIYRIELDSVLKN
ncbi:MAG: hypothetical protein GY940_35220 [bacterium]|nr:hypothetical protein [bacterium]